MKLNKVENAGANKVELEIFIEPAQVDEAAGEVFKREGKKYNLPGFRKGKAPRRMIEKRFGEDIFAFDAVNDMFPQVWEVAVAEAKIKPVYRPDVEAVSISLQDGAVLKATVVVKPEDIKVSKYTGLEAVKIVREVDEAEVDSEIDRLRQRGARIFAREDAAANDDTVTIDFEGFVDGTAFDGGKGEGFELKLGSGQFIPGFEDQIVGHMPGDAFDVNVTFPEDYQAEELAGKEAVFKVTLHKAMCTELPELDDEFAKDVSEYATLEELKDSIRKNIRERLDERADQEVEDALAVQIAETIEGDIPPEMYEAQMDDLMRNAAMWYEQQGMDVNMILRMTGQSSEEFRESFRTEAESVVKKRLALEAVARQEKIQVTEEDIDKEVDRLAERYTLEKDQVEKVMPRDVLAEDLAVKKAVEFVRSKAKITEKSAEEAEQEAKAKEEKTEDAPAKKPAKKATKKAEKAPAEKKAKPKKSEEKPAENEEK